MILVPSTHCRKTALRYTSIARCKCLTIDRYRSMPTLQSPGTNVNISVSYNRIATCVSSYFYATRYSMSMNWSCSHVNVTKGKLPENKHDHDEKNRGYYMIFMVLLLHQLLILTSCCPLHVIFPNTLGCDRSAMLMKISSAGCLYNGAHNLFWSRWCPMKPIDRPSTNKPFSVPI